MSVTREQALAVAAERPGEFHTQTYKNGRPEDRCGRARVNGKAQTWKRSPERFRIPWKYGMYQYGEVTEQNAGEFYMPEECPFCHPDKTA